MWSNQQQTCNQSSTHLPTLSQLQPAPSMLHSSSVSDMNSIYSAVIKVFQGRELQMNELYCLNESIRWLLKTEMGSFIKEYFQNQLLNKGFLFIFEQVQHEGERQLFLLANEWLRFFSETLPALQAIFYPLQELTVRQMALLGFRDLVLMRLPVEDLLPTSLPLLPTAITQMLLVLQGVHDPRGSSMEYYRLEKMLEMVVSPYLWNCKNKCYKEDARETRHLNQPEIRITQHISEGSLLSPLTEEEGETYLEKRGCGLRCHSMADDLSDMADMHLLSVSGRMHCGLTHNVNCGTSEDMRRENVFQVSHTF
ncbi:proline-rich protein 5-like isoform X2 [Brachyhypopomus gauderio]|uniref:proline-rich protein 5-like isoform X2 n=1 Tax=Brachyhypopomus gauderio TaxID=698409 RepID=UPI004041430D